MMFIPAHPAVQDYRIIERNGEFLPGGIELVNEDSAVLALDSVLDKPTLLTFVYYHCNGLCPKLLDGVVEAINLTDAELGSDYAIVTISIDGRETPKDAKRIKEKLVRLTNVPEKAQNNWYFFVTDSASIRKLTSAAGWNYKQEGDHFLHGMVSLLIAPNGMISQYFYGTYFNYMHLKLGIEKAWHNLTVPTRARVLKYCYNYTPENNKAFNAIAPVFGVSVVVLVVALFLYLALFRKKTVQPGKPAL
jgi:protein SCO1/2